MQAVNPTNINIPPALLHPLPTSIFVCIEVDYYSYYCCSLVYALIMLNESHRATEATVKKPIAPTKKKALIVTTGCSVRIRLPGTTWYDLCLSAAGGGGGAWSDGGVCMSGLEILVRLGADSGPTRTSTYGGGGGVKVNDRAGVRKHGLKLNCMYSLV